MPEINAYLSIDNQYTYIENSYIEPVPLTVDKKPILKQTAHL